MNLTSLERLARKVVKGENISKKSDELLTEGYITPAEHRSLESLSWQIAANLKADGSGGATYAIRRGIYGWWN